MDYNQPDKLENGHIFDLLYKSFWTTYKNAIEQYHGQEAIELTEHLLFLFDLSILYLTTGDSDARYAIIEQEDNIVVKYRSHYRHFADAHLISYVLFYEPLIWKQLVAKGIPGISQESDYEFTTEQQLAFLRRCWMGLLSGRRWLYLHDDEESSQQTINAPDTDEPDKNITKARQLLAIYYLLKGGLNIEARGNNAVSDVARFIHLFTGTKFTTLQNSEIYKKYAKMPEYKTGKPLIEDLDFIRPYFAALELNHIVELINEARQAAVNKLSPSERKKYSEE